MWRFFCQKTKKWYPSRLFLRRSFQKVERLADIFAANKH